MYKIKNLKTEISWWESNINETELLKPFRTEWETYHWNEIFNKIIKEYNFNNKKIFVGGCGTGLFEEWLEKHNKFNTKHIIGLDISKKMIQYARIRNKKNKKIKFILGDFEKTSFKNNDFDVCVFIDALHHAQNVENTLYEMKRIGKDLIISEPNALNPVRRYNELKFRYEGVKEISFYKWKLKKILNEIGYKKINLFHQHFIPNNIPKLFSKHLYKTDPYISTIPLLKEFSGSLLIIAKK